MERELSSTKQTIQNTERNYKIEELKRWFRTDYLQEIAKLERYKVLGIPHNKTRFMVEEEAYYKEQELLLLQNKEPLPPYKRNDLF